MGGRNSIWAVAVMVVAGVAGIVALAAVGDSEAATLLPLLIGFLAPTVTGLIAADKASANETTLKRVEGRLNGELDRRISEAVTRALTEYHGATREDCAGPECR
jgi:TctA family transporter